MTSSYHLHENVGMQWTAIFPSTIVYLDTRNYEVDFCGNIILVTGNSTSSSAAYNSYTHEVYLRNRHRQEIILSFRQDIDRYEVDFLKLHLKDYFGAL